MRKFTAIPVLLSVLAVVGGRAEDANTPAPVARATPIPIVIQNPTGGEVYFVGQPQTVRLATTTTAKSVQIQLSRDGGTTFDALGTIDNTVKDRTKRNTLVFTVNGPGSNACILKAVAGASTGLSGVFTIATDSSGAQSGSVTTAVLADGSVTNPKLAAGAVTNDKVSSAAASNAMVLQADGAGGALWGVANAANLAGILPIANGGTGSATKNFVDLTSDQSIAGNKTFAGTLTGNVTGNVSGSSATFTGSLAGDVTGTQSATVVSSVGGSSAADIHAAELLANAATTASTPNTIVKRDGSGNVPGVSPLAGDVTGPVTANAVASVGGSTAANVHAAELLANAATNANTASTIVKRDAGGNFSAGTVTATGFVGNSLAASAAGGSVTINAGSQPGSGPGGSITIQSGPGSPGNYVGDINLTAAAVTAGVRGNINITASDNSGGGGNNAGSVNIRAGNHTGAANGGSVAITGGSANGANSNQPGGVTITGGANTGSNPQNGAGASVVLAGGAQTATAALGPAGSVILQGGISSGTGAHGSIVLQTGSPTTTRLLVDPTGNVGIGTTTPQYPLDVNGGIRCVGAVNTTSDARYKTRVETLAGALGRVLKLRGVSYDWKREAFPEKNFDARRQLGFIAQEVRSVVPDVVSEDKDGYLAVAYAALTPLLVEAMKEQQQTVAALQDENAKLKSRLAELESKDHALNARLARIEQWMRGPHAAAREPLQVRHEHD